MTTAPFVELGFHPTDLRPRDLPRAGAFLGSPADAIEASLAVVRAAMVDRMKAEIQGIAQPTHAQLLRIADLAWQAMFWNYRKVSAPVMADAYVRAYRAANAGDVPMSVIYDLADRHAEKIGDYFHASSRDALAEGFSSMVNRRVPAKAAADRVLDAYGLTPRQMRGYTSATFDPPIWDVRPRTLKARARDYIDKSFMGRIRKLSAQEEHNIDQQAQQFAWMWLQDKGRLSEHAQKLWITAKDERVCEVCGPLHNKRVPVNEQFTTSHGEFWTPGLHPNCRCVVRLLEHTFTKAIDWDPKEHPRGGDPENKGRFSRVAERDRPTGPVIEPAAPEKTPEAAPPVTRRPLGSSTPKPLGASVRPAVRPRTTPLGRQPLGSSVERAPLGTPQTRAPLGTPQERTPLGDPLTRVPLGQGARPAPEPSGEPDLAPYRKTIPLHAGDGRPYYGVMHGIEHGDWDFSIDQVRFTDNLDTAKRKVAAERLATIEHEFKRVTGKGGTKPVNVKGITADGVPMYGRVSSEDFRWALTTVADQAQGQYEFEELPAAHQNVSLIWFDDEGHRLDEPGYISMMDVVTQQGVDPEDFVFTILEVTEGHNDENQTRFVSENIFDLSGSYVATDISSTVPDARGKETVITPVRPYY